MGSSNIRIRQDMLIMFQTIKVQEDELIMFQTIKVQEDELIMFQSIKVEEDESIMFLSILHTKHSREEVQVVMLETQLPRPYLSLKSHHTLPPNTNMQPHSVGVWTILPPTIKQPLLTRQLHFQKKTVDIQILLRTSKQTLEPADMSNLLLIGK